MLLSRNIQKKTSSFVVLHLNYLRYEPVQTRIVRQVERLGVVSADPHNYFSHYGNSLLETQQLLAQIRELGITEDLVCSFFFRQDF
jgi:hypothetical protein